MTARAVKCVFVGDGAVGKTCMLISRTRNRFPEDYIPTVFENYTLSITINGILFALNLIDTAGQEIYENLRTLSYNEANVIVLCFSVHLRSSFYNIATKWLPDIRKVAPSTPILLVGCQTDRRLDSSNAVPSMVRYDEGKNLAKEIHAVGYMECSAKSKDGLNEVFDKAVAIGAGLNQRKKRRCHIL